MVCGKCKKGGSGWGGGGQGGCEPKLNLLQKCTKKLGGVGLRWGAGGGGQGGCEPFIEVIVKMKKRKSGGVGVRVEVKEELKLL